MAKSRYDPLPQFSDSDSDIDIFNAKSSPTTKQKPQRSTIFNARKHLTTKSNKNLILMICTVAIIMFIVIGVCSVAALNRGKQTLNSNGIVHLTSGRVSGTKESVTIDNIKKTGYRFSGIPYAEPPVAERRWTAPVAKKEWSGVLKADTRKIQCIQYGALINESKSKPSEDCLYLHVHTPTLNRNANLPVLVWLHGGYSMNGFSDMHGYSPDMEFALSMNVVTVGVNFRLNAFGYLSLKELWTENISYGNYGLMDQTLALKWVQKNIQGFGGNPGSVTLLGQSSGGTSILALLASPPADGLFHKVISMSGSPYFPKTYQEASKSHRVFIKKSKCANVSEAEMKACLYKLTPPEVLEAIPDNWAMEDLTSFPTYGLIYDLVFVLNPVNFPKAPKDVAKISGLNTNVSIMIGNTAQEPGVFPNEHFKSKVNLTRFLEVQLKNFEVNFTADDVVKSYMSYIGMLDTQKMYETIVTDVRTTCYNNKLVKWLRDTVRLNNTYRYLVSYETKNPVKVNSMTPHNSFHSLDLFGLFGMKMFTDYKPNEQDKRFINSMRRTVKKFIMDGTIKDAKPGDTILFNKDGSVAAQSKEYHVKQCDNFWNDKKFLNYTWIN